MRNKTAAIFIFLFFAIFQEAFGQFSWWNELHGWKDGMPSWKTFMNISPGYLGINALPVPTQVKGMVASKAEGELSVDLHFLDGENAQNPYFRIFYPSADGRMAIEIWGMPYEWYSHDLEIRNLRKSRIVDGKGSGAGDFYFSAMFTVLKDQKYLPGMVLRMACKTASGNLAGARFSDTPGYWFDLSLGKSFQMNSCSLRPFAMAGFYCWHTTGVDQSQNDASLYGMGIEFLSKSFRAEGSFQGYHGYKNDGDHPENIRIIAAKSLKNNELKLEYQHGTRDVLYRSVRLGWVQRF